MKTNYLRIYLSIAFLLLFSCNEEAIFDKENSKETPEVYTEHGEGVPVDKSKIDICGEVTEVRLMAGQHIPVGSVLVYNDQDYLYVEFQTEDVEFQTENGKYQAEDDWYIDETHLYVGSEEEIPTTSSGNPKIGLFPYASAINPLYRPIGARLSQSSPKLRTQSSSNTLEKRHIYRIALNTIEDECFVVAAHADVKRVNENNKVIQQETAWGEGEQIKEGGSWAMFFEACKQECVVEYPKPEKVVSVAYEDLYPNAGDADYNDLVVDMNIKEFYLEDQITRIEVIARPKARGTGLDHNFLLHLPVEGKASVSIKRYMNKSKLDANEPYEVVEMNNQSGDLSITVFPNTKKVLPPPPSSIFTNTLAGTKLIESRVAKVVIEFEDNAKVLMPPPYDPVLHVIKGNREIHVLELTNLVDADGDGKKDYWMKNGKIHPFGIIIPTDWAWPLEKVNILTVYPDFYYIKVGSDFKPAKENWYLNRVGNQYFRPELFN